MENFFAANDKSPIKLQKMVKLIHKLNYKNILQLNKNGINKKACITIM